MKVKLIFLNGTPFFIAYSYSLFQELSKTLQLSIFSLGTSRVMRLESYSTAGISFTQCVPRGGCLVGFTPLVCVCVYVNEYISSFILDCLEFPHIYALIDLFFEKEEP